MHIYLITNEITGKLYVGQTVNSPRRRFKSHCNQARRHKNCGALHYAILKHGEAAFSISVLQDCGNCSQDELNEAEALWIKQLGCLSPNGYNLTEGGGSFGTPSEETKRKLSEANKGRSYQRTEEETERFSKMMQAAHARRKEEGKSRGSPSAETRAKISESWKMRPPISDETRMRMSAAQVLSGKHTDEAKKKMSDSLKARPPFTDKHKENLRIARRVRAPHSEETKAKMAESQRVRREAEKNALIVIEGG